VASTLPEEILYVQVQPVPLQEKQPLPRLSQQGQQAMRSPLVLRMPSPPMRAFQMGLPALDEFPFDVWSRLTAQRYQHPSCELLTYGDPAGYRPLRDAIAQY